jgi:hypothetical protein
MMAKRNGASMQAAHPKMALWAERQTAARHAAEQEIALLRPGEAVVYHEGNLAVDIAKDPMVAGRAAAYRDATETDEGITAQRRLGFERYEYIFWRHRREHR